MAAGHPLQFQNNAQLAALLNASLQQWLQSHPGADPLSDPGFQKLVAGGQVQYHNGQVVAYDPLYDNGALAHVGTYAGNVGMSVTGAAILKAAGDSISNRTQSGTSSSNPDGDTGPTAYPTSQALGQTSYAGPTTDADGNVTYGTGEPGTTIGNDPGSGGRLSSLFGGLTGRDYLNAGLNVAGSLIASHQVSKAVDAQQQAAHEALAQQAAIYQQQRSDLSPWVRSGGGAVNQLNYLLGITPSGGETIPALQGPKPTTQGAPVGASTLPPMEQNKIAPQNLGSLGNVMMQAPTGETQAVPANQAAQYEARGARRI